MDALERIVREAYDRRIVGLALEEVTVDRCTTKTLCGGKKAGRSPVDRGKRGIERSVMVGAESIPLGVVAAPANRRDSLVLSETLDTVVKLPQRSRWALARAYDSEVVREILESRELIGVISK